MQGYSVKKLAKLAGVSVRTLHHYDRLGLLKPSLRTQARYRLYGEKELLRLQQILLYKELDFSLQEIGHLLDKEDFDLLEALQRHKTALQCKRDRLGVLLETIDKTILKLKGEPVMLTNEQLYEGFPKGKGEAYRQEAMQKWGADTVEKSENHLRNLGKEGFEKLKTESEAIWQQLLSMTHQDPVSNEVQAVIARHYAVIRQFWGTAQLEDQQAEAYKGLGQLYLSDERYTLTEGKPNPAVAAFLNKAMVYYADNRLKG